MNSQTFYHSLRTFSKLPDVCLLIIIHVDEQYAKGHNINPFWMLLIEQDDSKKIVVSSKANIKA